MITSNAPGIALAVVLTAVLCLPAFSQDFIVEEVLPVRLEDNVDLSAPVATMYEDRRGFLWFGTLAGLRRYDGHQTVVYEHDPDDQWSISGNSVMDIAEDANGNLWVTVMGGGLNKFDPRTEKFTRYKAHTEHDQGLMSNLATSVSVDRDGVVWLSTQEGLSSYDPQADAYRHWKDLRDPVLGQINPFTYTNFVDESGSLWGIFGNAVAQYDGDTSFAFFRPSDLGRRVFSKCFIESPNTILLFTWRRLWRFDLIDKSWTRLLPSTRLTFTDMLRVDDETYLGTHLEGIGYYNPIQDTWEEVKRNNELNDLFLYSDIGLFQDSGDNIWLYGHRAFKWSRHAGAINYYQIKQSDGEIHTFALRGFDIFAKSMYRFDGHRIGIGKELIIDPNDMRPQYLQQQFQELEIKGNFLNAYNENDRTIWFWSFRGETVTIDTVNVSQQSIGSFTMDFFPAGGDLSLVVDLDRNLWMGSLGGLFQYELATAELTAFRHDPLNVYSISSDVVRTVFQDESGRIWVGTEGGGLNLYDTGLGGFIRFQHDPANNKSISNNSIYCILESKNGTIWVGTETGINAFNPADSSFTRYTRKEGLKSSMVTNLEEDNAGYLWLAGNRGLTRFDPTTGDVKHFDQLDGLIEEELGALHSSIRTDDGTLLIGAFKGLNVIRPDRLEKDSVAPQVYITGFQLYSKTIHPGGEDGLLESGISYTDKVVLKHHQDVITLEYAALNYANPKSNMYAYQLEGFNDTWQYVGNKQEVTYTNLDPGRYTFRVIGSNSDGVWSDEGASLQIVVLPPWWQTWWAQTVYVILFIASVIGYIQWRTYALRKRQKELEQTVTERTAEVVAQKNELAEKNQIITREKERSEELLLNILPSETAEELKKYGSAQAKNYETVTVLFTDFKDFTKHSEQFTPEELVAEIDYCFKAFDVIMEEHNVEKIKTVGDAYMAAAGLPTPNSSNPEDAVRAAIAVRDFMTQYRALRAKENRRAFEIRIGVHTGPVVAGIVGIKKFAYDIWGDTVNLAARMESSGQVGKVNVSQSTYDHLHDSGEFTFTARGKVEAKNKGEIHMYFVENNHVE